MKALVSIQFAIELDDEDQLVEMAQALDASLRQSIENHIALGMDRDGVELLEIGGMIDWYGANVAIKRPVFAGVGGDE